MERLERCDRCRWWVRTEAMDRVLTNGLCYCFPPTLCELWVNRQTEPEPLEEPDLWIRPATEEDEFCGQFTAMEQSPAARS